MFQVHIKTSEQKVRIHKTLQTSQSITIGTKHPKTSPASATKQARTGLRAHLGELGLYMPEREAAQKRHGGERVTMQRSVSSVSFLRLPEKWPHTEALMKLNLKLYSDDFLLFLH